LIVAAMGADSKHDKPHFPIELGKQNAWHTIDRKRK